MVQFVLQRLQFVLGFQVEGYCFVVGLDGMVKFVLKFFLHLDESQQFFLDDVVGLPNLRNLNTVLLAMPLLLRYFLLAFCDYASQSFLLSFFFLPLHPQRLKLSLQLCLFILQSRDFYPQFLRNQLIAVPLFNQTLYLVFFLNQLLVSELYPLSSGFVLAADVVIDVFQGFHLIFQAFCLLFDDFSVLFDAFSFCQSTIDLIFQFFNLLIIKILIDYLL